MVRDSALYMLGNYVRGDFPAAQLTPKMKRWAGRAADARGSEFAREVSSRLTELGWQTAVEIRVTRFLNRGFDRDYGDVDVVAWQPASRRILMIECKDVHYRKTYGEIAEQLADFRVELRSNGRPDYLRRHLDRIAVISQHLDAVSSFTGITPVENVESHLLFRNPVPMEFALRQMSQKVRVSHFNQIASL